MSEKMKKSRSDMNYTVEDGAYCLAMLVVKKITDLTAFEQAQRGSGIDYLLTDNYEVDDIDYKARLEVSGLFKGTKSQIQYRL